jgi:rSAM/selenodomain-associated transferase 2
LRIASVRLSVVIPALNEGAVIAGLLKDLQPLRELGCELIVVDGGSGDNTRELARPLADRVLVSEPGRALQMNRGAATASGDWLWFVHADSRLLCEASRYLQAIVDGPSPWGRFDVRLDVRGRVFRLIETMMNLRSRLSGIVTGDQGLFVRRDLFERSRGYAGIPLMEDIELSRRLRLQLRPHCVHGLRLGASARRWQRHGVLRTLLLMWRLRLAYFLGAEPAGLAKVYRQCASPTQES